MFPAFKNTIGHALFGPLTAHTWFSLYQKGSGAAGLSSIHETGTFLREARRGEAELDDCVASLHLVGNRDVLISLCLSDPCLSMATLFGRPLFLQQGAPLPSTPLPFPTLPFLFPSPPRHNTFHDPLDLLSVMGTVVTSRRRSQAYE